MSQSKLENKQSLMSKVKQTAKTSVKAVTTAVTTVAVTAPLAFAEGEVPAWDVSSFKIDPAPMYAVGIIVLSFAGVYMLIKNTKKTVTV